MATKPLSLSLCLSVSLSLSLSLSLPTPYLPSYPPINPARGSGECCTRREWCLGWCLGRQRIFDHFDSGRDVSWNSFSFFLLLVLMVYLLKAQKGQQNILHQPDMYYKLSDAHQPVLCRLGERPSPVDRPGVAIPGLAPP